MNNIYPDFNKLVSRERKEQRLKQKGRVIWFTGLSGAGKTTLATALEERLFDLAYHTQVLDGDNIRSGLNKNLGFSDADRLENIRRIAEVAKLFIDAGVICICSFVSPSEIIRQQVRSVVGSENIIEIYVSTPIEVCEQRDVKGLYQKAREGKIPNFTGISARFEMPQYADMSIDTSEITVAESIDYILKNTIPKISMAR